MSQSDRSPSHHFRLRIRQGRTLAAVLLLLTGLDAPWPTAAANAGPCNVSCQERCGKVLDGCKDAWTKEIKGELAECLGTTKGFRHYCKADKARALAGCLDGCPDDGAVDMCRHAANDEAAACERDANEETRACKADVKDFTQIIESICQQEHASCMAGCN